MFIILSTARTTIVFGRLPGVDGDDSTRRRQRRIIGERGESQQPEAHQLLPAEDAADDDGGDSRCRASVVPRAPSPPSGRPWKLYTTYARSSSPKSSMPRATSFCRCAAVLCEMLRERKRARREQ